MPNRIEVINTTRAKAVKVHTPLARQVTDEYGIVGRYEFTGTDSDCITQMYVASEKRVKFTTAIVEFLTKNPHGVIRQRARMRKISHRNPSIVDLSVVEVIK